jgi:hypothetical protein
MQSTYSSLQNYINADYAAIQGSIWVQQILNNMH